METACGGRRGLQTAPPSLGDWPTGVTGRDFVNVHVSWNRHISPLPIPRPVFLPIIVVASGLYPSCDVDDESVVGNGYCSSGM